MMHNSNIDVVDPENICTSRFLVIVGDSLMASILNAHLRTHFPGVFIDFVDTPIASPGYDVYFVNASCFSTRQVKRFTSQVRVVGSSALVVCCVPVIKTLDLVEFGCDALYNKRYFSKSVNVRRMLSNLVGLKSGTRVESLSLKSSSSYEKEGGSLVDASFCLCAK